MADLHLHRILKAPRSAVWRCWTDPAHIPNWFAPKPVVTEVRALDVRRRIVRAHADDPCGETMQRAARDEAGLRTPR